MVPSEGSPGSSLDLSSDSDVSPNGLYENGPSQTISVNGKVSVPHTSTTDNSRQSSAFVDIAAKSPIQDSSGQVQGISVDTVASQNGTLKRKREESGDPTSPLNHSLTSNGESSRIDSDVDMERSQKRSQKIPEQFQDASLQNGSHPIEEKHDMAPSNVPAEPPGPSQLSTEIWQHIFSFVPPISLGRLLRVNRAFNKSLTPADCEENVPLTGGALPYRSANSIWAVSRNRFARGIPKPVPGLNELQMWRLLRGNSCQICGAKKPLCTTHASPDPWQSGPGSDGVRVFWAFGIRSCGPCMRNASEKVIFLF